MVLGTKQNSDVSTLGGSAVAGRGYIVGARANITLPGSDIIFHSLSTGSGLQGFRRRRRPGGGRVQHPDRLLSVGRQLRCHLAAAAGA